MSVSLSPWEYMSAVSKKLMPASRAMPRTLSASRAPCLPAKTPPILDPPKPISETLMPVFPNELSFTELSAPQVVGQLRRGARRESHDGKGRVLLAGRCEAGRVAHQHAGCAIYPVPGIHHAILGIRVHAGRSAVVG